jgi:hypothetical protein
VVRGTTFVAGQEDFLEAEFVLLLTPPNDEGISTGEGMLISGGEEGVEGWEDAFWRSRHLDNFN